MKWVRGAALVALGVMQLGCGMAAYPGMGNVAVLSDGEKEAVMVAHLKSVRQCFADAAGKESPSDKPELVPQGGLKAPTQVLYSPDGETVAAAGYASIVLYTKEGLQIGAVEGDALQKKEADQLRMVYSSDGKQLLVWSFDVLKAIQKDAPSSYPALVVSAKTSEVVHHCQVTKHEMFQGSHVAPGGKRGIVASSPPALVDGQTGKKMPLDGAASIMQAAFSPDGSHLLASAMDATTYKFGLQVYDAGGMRSGLRRESAEGHTFMALATSNDGSTWMYVDVAAGKITIHATKSSSPDSLFQQEGWSMAGGVAPDGKEAIASVKPALAHEATALPEYMRRLLETDMTLEYSRGLGVIDLESGQARELPVSQYAMFHSLDEKIALGGYGSRARILDEKTFDLSGPDVRSDLPTGLLTWYSKKLDQIHVSRNSPATFWAARLRLPQSLCRLRKGRPGALESPNPRDDGQHCVGERRRRRGANESCRGDEPRCAGALQAK